MITKKLSAGIVVSVCLAAARLPAQSPRVLYTWKGTGDVQGWFKSFGDNIVTLENATDGELTVTESDGLGSGFAISDDFNRIAEGEPGIGGLDLTGLSAIEVDVGHDGTDPVDVQFFVQASSASTFVVLGDIQAVEPAVKTYSLPLDGLSREQIAYIRTIGLNVQAHADQGDLAWTLREVRSAGTPLKARDIATHEPGTSDGGLQGAIANFEQSSIDGNDGGQNQTGLRNNTSEPPAGNTGSLQWTDLGTGNGAAVTWSNGTVFAGNTFNERPADLSNYAQIVIRMAAANVSEGAVESVGVQYFLQTRSDFLFTQAGEVAMLPADGAYHDLTFDISAVPRLDFVNTHGVNLQAHAGADLQIDVDFVRAESAAAITDCNHNKKDDGRDLIDGTSKDCNENVIPDECDIASAASGDCDQNGIPDECDIAPGPRTRVLYTWNGTGDPQGWFKNFGTNDLTVENSVEGELTVTETGQDGSNFSVNDSFNTIAEGGTSTGGLDATGMTSLEVDMGHSGTGPVQAQFFVQARPDFNYVALGPDVGIEPGVKTYVLPLDGLSPAHAAYIRAIGINVRDHFDQGNLTWTIQEVRISGVPLTQRDYATHEPGTSDGGLQGAVVSSGNGAVEGNDGGVNQTGLLLNTGASPPGNTGSLEWTDLAGQGGGAVAWFNGTAFGGDTFNERPTDLSPYTEIEVRIAAANIRGGAVEEVALTYVLETGGFQQQQAGDAQVLPCDGEFHSLVFPIAGIADLAYTDAHGLNLADHPEGDLRVDVDRVRAISRAPTANDCNGNRIPDSCDIANGVLHDANGNGKPDECETPGGFRRGDANADGRLDISDAVSTLGCLFLGGVCPGCLDAADSNDSGKVDLSDAVYTLNRLFIGGPAIPDPGPDACGEDPTPDDLVDCDYPASQCP